MVILNTLAPVFLLMAVGAGLRRRGLVSAGFVQDANRVTYWVGLPALLFSQLAGAPPGAGGAGLMLTVLLVATALVVLAGYAAARLLRVPGAAAGTFVQGGFRGNLAFVGLPVIFSLPETPLAWGVSARMAAVLAVAPMMVAYNIAGVVVLLLSQHRLGWGMLKPFLKQLATTPPLLATLAGMGWALAGWTLPAAVDRTLTVLGEMALPLGLLAVGGSLAAVRAGTAWRVPLAAAVVKTVVSPVLGWVAGRALGLGPAELKMVLILMACPTAIASYTMAVELKGDEGLASGVISWSVFTSLGSLAVIVGWL